MKKPYQVLAATTILSALTLPADAQMGTSCLGCMPRTGPVYDSTSVTPAPPFTTTATTGNVYIPPREVQVPAPAPAPTPRPPDPVDNDPLSFPLSGFRCAAGSSGVGYSAMENLVVQSYLAKGRCADEGFTYWSGQLRSLMGRWYGEGKVTTDPERMSQSSLSQYMGQSWSNIGPQLAAKVGSAADRQEMENLCSDGARKLKHPTAYDFVWSTGGAVCAKMR